MKLDESLQGVDRDLAIRRVQSGPLLVADLLVRIVSVTLALAALYALAGLVPAARMFFERHTLLFIPIAVFMALPFVLWLDRSKALEAWTASFATRFVDARNRRRVQALQASGAIILHPDLVWIGSRVDIAPGAQISGPAVIEDDVTISGTSRIGPHAKLWKGVALKGACVLDEGVVIRADATVTDSVLGKDVRVLQGATVTGCSIGDGGRVWTVRPVFHVTLLAGEVIEDLPDGSRVHVRSLMGAPEPAKPAAEVDAAATSDQARCKA